jgi:hypothetical protein
MRQAIVTKFLGPTDRHGARVKATAQAGSVTITWDDALAVDTNHYRAARLLAMKYNWLSNGYHLIGGGLPDDSGNVYVLVHTVQSDGE